MVNIGNILDFLYEITLINNEIQIKKKKYFIASIYGEYRKLNFISKFHYTCTTLISKC